MNKDESLMTYVGKVIEDNGKWAFTFEMRINGEPFDEAFSGFKFDTHDEAKAALKDFMKQGFF